MSDERVRPCVLLFAPTTGYQIRMFDEAAARLGIDLVLATDRCDRLDDPWNDRAIPVRFHDDGAAVRAVREALGSRPVAGVLAVGDRPAVLAATVASVLGLPWHAEAGARAGCDKRLFRAAQQAAGLPCPWTRTLDAGEAAPADVAFPCVVKPLVLSGSRGVIRADDAASLARAVARVRAILDAPDVRALRDPAASRLLIEGYIDGHEFALEGLMERGDFQVLALFDKPTPLAGPFFEETIYLTPTAATRAVAHDAAAAVSAAARAAGLWHGPVHAECRLTADGTVVVLEAAARPIGGLCARALRFVSDGGDALSLEQVLLEHAVGRGLHATRQPGASGVMMVPIARAGVLREVTGQAAARAVPLVRDVVISAVPGQVLHTLPESSSYLGFIFADGLDDGEVLTALTTAHAALSCVVAPMVPLQRADG